jgi:hypothetical protein
METDRLKPKSWCLEALFPAFPIRHYGPTLGYRLFLFLAVFYLTIAIVPSALSTGTPPPMIADYPTKTLYSQKPAPVDFKSHPKAWTYRTRLREGAAKGPNFAGHYTLVRWGCGSSCLYFAVVDAISGRVIFPEKIIPIFFIGLPQDAEIDYDMIFDRKSSLLIIHGTPTENEKAGSYYYNFVNNRFELIKSVEWESDSSK